MSSSITSLTSSHRAFNWKNTATNIGASFYATSAKIGKMAQSLVAPSIPPIWQEGWKEAFVRNFKGGCKVTLLYGPFLYGGIYQTLRLFSIQENPEVTLDAYVSSLSSAEKIRKALWSMFSGPIQEEVIFRFTQPLVYSLSLRCFFSVSKSWRTQGKNTLYANRIARILSAVEFGAAHLSNKQYMGNKKAIAQAIYQGLIGYFVYNKILEKDGLLGTIGWHIGNNVAVVVPMIMQYDNVSPKS